MTPRSRSRSRDREASHRRHSRQRSTRGDDTSNRDRSRATRDQEPRARRRDLSLGRRSPSPKFTSSASKRPRPRSSSDDRADRRGPRDDSRRRRSGSYDGSPRRDRHGRRSAASSRSPSSRRTRGRRRSISRSGSRGRHDEDKRRRHRQQSSRRSRSPLSDSRPRGEKRDSDDEDIYRKGEELSKYRKHHQTAVAPPTKSNEYERISESSGWWLHKGGQWRWHQDTNMYFNGEDNQYYHISLSTGRCRVIRDKDDPLFEEMQKCERERAKSLEEAKTSSRVDPEFVDWEEAQKLASSSGRKKSLEERSSMSENATSDVAKDDTNPSSPAGDSPARRAATDGPRKDYKIGRVAKFDQTRGFGFIYRSYEDSPSPSQRHHFEDDEVLFVHRKGIAGSTLEKPLNLDPGAPVRYLISSERESAVSSTKTRDQAVDVSMLSDPTDVDSVLPIHDPDHCSDPNDSKAAKLSSSLLSHGESWPGLKKTLQDRTIVGASLDAFGMLYGVFDGHGGSSVADILVKEMPRKLLFQLKAAQLQPSSPSVDIAAAITAAFQQVDKDILDSCERKPQLQPQGSTATIFIVNYSTPPRMIVASVGDSRTVLCRDGRAIVLTRDHDPEDPIERSRVEKAGGQIMMVQGVARVCTSKTKRVMQGLAMTRSIGDYYFKRPHALSIPDPDVQILPLDQKDCFVLLASDGIFEKTMTNDQAVALAAERLKAEGPEGAAKAVIRNAYSQGSEDNLSCICVQFDWHDAKSLDVILKRAKANATPATQPIPAAAVEDDSFDMFA
ncbi:hypothetical protein FOZ62_006970 [Perkinsus olseni]|uniref:PPM-type phosphatase domain-containing protein n=1 Tax=Perkinsus olseni TaxID=32597 RepID=A0A7J6N785_PEROL|nr:hypothetical protein FOZ62_006970 [Perkinsus olseni]